MSKWLRFLRQYGPISNNDNMHDETIQRSSRRAGMLPIVFHHPFHNKLMDLARQLPGTSLPVILTGTAGDGKTHLCRLAWNELGGNEIEWGKDDPHLGLSCGTRSVHFIRDLSAWVPQQGQEWPAEKAALLDQMCRALFDSGGADSFVLAANDGQLIECWNRLPSSLEVNRAKQVIEDLLVEDCQEKAGSRLQLLNLSRTSSAKLLNNATEALLNHKGWEDLLAAPPDAAGLFGQRCPIRRNFQILQSDLVRSRLGDLLQLCDSSNLHVPIRQILILLTNALLGHPDVKDCLMSPADVPRVIAAGTVSKASFYNNVFGGNLSENRRHSVTVFEFLGRFQVGHETSNRFDNLLIFGENDGSLAPLYERYIGSDTFYGADERFRSAKHEYVEGPSGESTNADEFLDLLVSRRRGLFFQMPREDEAEWNPWRLTVFRFAGEYLDTVVAPILRGGQAPRQVVSRLVKGLNRVFTGQLATSERDLWLATNGNYSQAKVSRIFVERVSVEPNKGESVVLCPSASGSKVVLRVYLSPDECVDLDLTLVRYEFLSRVASDGAFPRSFSKQCYEDLVSFKSRLLAACRKRQGAQPPTPTGGTICLSMLALTEQGNFEPTFLEVTP